MPEYAVLLTPKLHVVSSSSEFLAFRLDSFATVFHRSRPTTIEQIPSLALAFAARISISAAARNVISNSHRRTERRDVHTVQQPMSFTRAHRNYWENGQASAHAWQTSDVPSSFSLSYNLQSHVNYTPNAHMCPFNHIIMCKSPIESRCKLDWCAHAITSIELRETRVKQPTRWTFMCRLPPSSAL